mgnify:CR=1 FL=1
MCQMRRGAGRGRGALPALRNARLEARSRRTALFPEQACRGAESIAQSRRRTADGDARVRVALLRAAESHFADGAPLGALRRGRGSDAVDLVRTADARARHPDLLPTDGGRRRHRHLRVDHLRCAARGALVPRARAADARLGVRRRIPAELSAARRQKVAPFLHRDVHRRGGPHGDGRRILH